MIETSRQKSAKNSALFVGLRCRFSPTLECFKRVVHWKTGLMTDEQKKTARETEFLALLASVPADEREEVLKKLIAFCLPKTATEIDAERPIL